MIEDDGELPNIWVISLADMSMLLMSFFIFLFSLSAINPQNVNETLESVRQSLHPDKTKPTITPPPTRIEPDKALEKARLREQIMLRQRQVFDDLQRFLAAQKADPAIKAALRGPRLVTSLPTDGMFPPGDAQLTELGRARLTVMKDFLSRHAEERINIRGFSDDQPPPPQSRFRDNWELSSVRAVAALRYLVSQGVPANRLTATGLADLEPVLPNTSDDNRSRNRRLEFVLEIWVEE